MYIIGIFGGKPCIFEESPPVFTIPGADTEKSQNLKAIAKEMSISGMLDTGGGALNKIEIIQKEWKGAKTFPSQTSIVLKKALGQGLGIPIFLEALEATVAGNPTAVDIKAVVAPSPEMDGFVKESRFRVLDGHHRWAAGLLILGDAFMLKGSGMVNTAGPPVLLIQILLHWRIPNNTSCILA